MKIKTVLFCFLITACTKVQAPRLCENQLSMIEDDSHISYNQKVDINFNGLIEILEGHLEVTHRDSDIVNLIHLYLGKQLVHIPIAYSNYSRLETEPPPFNPWKNGFHLYITKSNEIIHLDRKIKLDSIATEVTAFLTSRPAKGLSSVFFPIHWGATSDLELLSKLIDEVLKAYLNFIEQEAEKQFGAKLCLLNKSEIQELKTRFRFLITINRSESDFLFNVSDN